MSDIWQAIEDIRIISSTIQVKNEANKNNDKIIEIDFKDNTGK